MFGCGCNNQCWQHLLDRRQTREGTIVPEAAVIETQEQADALPTR